MKKTEKEGKAMMTRATRPKKENQRMTKNPGVILALCIIGFDVIKIVTAILTVLTGIWPHEYARGLALAVTAWAVAAWLVRWRRAVWEDWQFQQSWGFKK